MRFSTLCLAATLFSQVQGQQTLDGSCVSTVKPPYVAPKVMLGGTVTNLPSTGNGEGDDDEYVLADVQGCCTVPGDGTNENGIDIKSTSIEPAMIGQMPQMSTDQTMKVLADAKQAWSGGMGIWPQMSLKERIMAVETLLQELTKIREDIVETLMWEIGKNRKDAESEFDRTVSFVRNVIDVIRTDPEFASSWQTVGSVKAHVRRAAIGIIMCLGPMNYPLNETYATLIPALLMGNVAIMKIPTVGGLAHLLTMEAFAKALPPGAMNFVSGRGRETMPPLMKTGDVDGLAFIGGSAAADDLIRQHPHPHRLKVFLQLEAKNMAIFLPDLFENGKELELSQALDQAVLGSLSFNGQRCTALKIFFVPKQHGETFALQLAKRVESKSVGLPWQTWTTGDGSTNYSSITPLPSQKQVNRMRTLIDDATSKGAKIINEKGGEIIGGTDSTLMIPAVLYPVTPDMDIYTEEQFGPIVPVTTYESIDTMLQYGQNGIYGQQVSIFVSDDGAGTGTAQHLIDNFSSIFGKININTQCGRSPDTVPFSGRRSSAMGVMSVRYALMEFSIPTVLSYKDTPLNNDIMEAIEPNSKFLQPL